MNDYKIKKIYEDMEMDLISSMKRNLSRHLKEEEKVGFKYTQWQAEKLKELKRYQRQNKSIIGSYTSNLSKEVSKQLQDELKQGSVNAINQYNKITGNSLNPSKIMNKSFFQTNDKKVNALINSVNNDLKRANTAVLRMTNDQYRQVIHKSTMYVANGVYTEKQAAKMATEELSNLELTKLGIDDANKDFLSRGLNCIEYKDGRRVNLASYSQMAVRTANLRAQLMGEGDFRKSIGRILVMSTSHGGACPICQKWEKHIFIDDVYSGGTKDDGDYMLLSEAMEQGFLHPNCRHGLTTYYPELENIENESEEEYQKDIDEIQEKLNYMERNEKKYDRLATGSVDPDNIAEYMSKKKEWSNKKNALIDESKLYYVSADTGDNITLEELLEETRNTISDRFQERTAGTKVKSSDTGGSYFYLLDGNIYLSDNADKYTFIHELGHKLQTRLTKSEKKVYNNIIGRKFSKYTKSDFKVVVKSDGKKYWILKDSSNFVSKYQSRIYDRLGNFNPITGKVNSKYAKEYLSEGVMYYYKNPSLLKEKDVDLYNFIKEVIE